MAVTGQEKANIRLSQLQHLHWDTTVLSFVREKQRKWMLSNFIIYISVFQAVFAIWKVSQAWASWAMFSRKAYDCVKHYSGITYCAFWRWQLPQHLLFFSLWHFQKEQLCCSWSPVPGKQLLMLFSPPFWLLCKECFFQVFWNSHIAEKLSSPLQATDELSGPGLSTEIEVTHDSASLATHGCSDIFSNMWMFDIPNSFVFLEGKWMLLSFPSLLCARDAEGKKVLFLQLGLCGNPLILTASCAMVV